jgi:hypothetical protein
MLRLAHLGRVLHCHHLQNRRSLQFDQQHHHLHLHKLLKSQKWKKQCHYHHYHQYTEKKMLFHLRRMRLHRPLL